MDGHHFDRWTRSISGNPSTRRSLARLALAAGTALVGGGIAAGEALACRKNGGKCERDGQCCSGTCKKVRKGVKKCVRTAGAFGCTVNLDSCTAGEVLACPKKPGGFCVKLDNGRPFCAVGNECFSCQSDQDCQEIAPGAGGHCVSGCPICAGINGPICLFAR